MTVKTYPTSSTNFVSKLPGSLPAGNVPKIGHPSEVATILLDFLNTFRAENFTPDAIWRDSFAFTGTLRTFYSPATIQKVWEKLSLLHMPKNFRVLGDSCRIADAGPESSWIEARFLFEADGTPQTTCSGFASLVYHPQTGWKIWVLRTILEQLVGHGDVDTLAPPKSLPNGLLAQPRGHGDVDNLAPPKSLSEGLLAMPNHPDKPHFECLIVGGGQSGLSTAGRLKALGVSYLVVEKNANVGDNWKLRYDLTKCMFPRCERFFWANPDFDYSAHF
jgi:hypothetical protein